MQRIGVRELRQHASRYLALVARGEWTQTEPHVEDLRDLVDRGGGDRAAGSAEAGDEREQAGGGQEDEGQLQK